MTDIPRHIFASPYDTPLAEWWEGCYDHFYVVLNPFFRVDGYHPLLHAYGPQHVGSKSVAEVLSMIQNPPEYPRSAPVGFENVVKEQGVSVTWREVFDQIEGSDFNRFARTVWLWAVGHADESEADTSIINSLDNLRQETGLYPPEEDWLPAITEPTLFDYFTALEIEIVQLWSEWRDESCSCPVTNFASNLPTLEVEGNTPSAVTADGIMIHWQYDEVHGLICLTEAQRQKADPAKYFEGYWLPTFVKDAGYDPLGLAQFLSLKTPN